jgi:CBS domain-containing protein
VCAGREERQGGPSVWACAGQPGGWNRGTGVPHRRPRDKSRCPPWMAHSAGELASVLEPGGWTVNEVWKVLQSKGNRVWSVGREASVLDALKAMAEHKTGSILVMDGERLVGIFTERDYARKLGLGAMAPGAVLVQDVMTTELITVTPAHSVTECMAIMTEKRIRHLPVVEDDRVIGLISIGDVVKDIIEELQFMLQQMEKYVSGLR